MKKSYKNIKRISLLTLLFVTTITQFAWADKSRVVVTEVRGNAFVLQNGKTALLKSGDTLTDFSEIVTEVGSQVTFSDYSDHSFFLAGSGQIKILNKLIELSRGYLWIQSHANHSGHRIQTANATIEYKRGESIISFDHYVGKTQLLVIKGKVGLENVLQKGTGVVVHDGKFSFVDDDYNNGIPRKPTNIGFASFKKVTSLFEGVEPVIKDDQINDFKNKSSRSRALASINEQTSFDVKLDKEAAQAGQGRIIYLTKQKKFVKNSVNLDKLYKEELRLASKRPVKKWAPNRTSKSKVQVHIYGLKGSLKTNMKSKRLPASVNNKSKKNYQEIEEVISIKSALKNSGRKKSRRTPASLNRKVKIKTNDNFESSLVDEYKQQLRHSGEVNSLIDDLKTYDQDYKKEY